MNTLKMIFMMYFKLAFQKNKGHIVIWKQKSLFRRLFLYLSRRMRLVDIRRSPPGIRNQKLANWSMIKIQCGRNKVNWWFLWSIDLWSFSLTGLVLRCICLPPLYGGNAQIVWSVWLSFNLDTSNMWIIWNIILITNHFGGLTYTRGTMKATTEGVGVDSQKLS